MVRPVDCGEFCGPLTHRAGRRLAKGTFRLRVWTEEEGVSYKPAYKPKLVRADALASRARLKNPT